MASGAEAAAEPEGREALPRAFGARSAHRCPPRAKDLGAGSPPRGAATAPRARVRAPRVQSSPAPRVDVERVGLAAAAIERHHLELNQALLNGCARMSASSWPTSSAWRPSS